ncbi:MAG: transglutaminase family protein [Bacteroidales bacterium]|nr:transglutaminase family protein [Bacteroidales bacterium]
MTALLSLLDDPDRTVYHQVVNRLVEMGEPAIYALEKRWELSVLDNQQEQIEKVIRQIQFSQLKKDIINWRLSGGKDLHYGAWLIARVQYPDLRYNTLKVFLEKIERNIWLELNDGLTALEKIRVINYFIYTIHGFERSSKKTTAPQLFCINHLLESRRGNPVLLGLFYAGIAQKLELPVFGVNLPGNFLLCYFDEACNDDPDRILFYINPHNKGAVLGREELKLYLNQINMDPDPFYFSPCSNTNILERLIYNLKHAYKQTLQEEKINMLQELAKSLKNR